MKSEHSMISILTGMILLYSNSQSDQCKIIYIDGSISPAFSYVYSDSIAKVLLDDKLIYSGADKYKVYHDVKLAVDAAASFKPMKECFILDGESIDISINNTTYHNFNFVHECNDFDSTSRNLIFRAISAFHLSRSDIYAKKKPIFDALIKDYRKQILNTIRTPSDF